MKLDSSRSNADLQNILNEVFEVVIRSGVTKFRKNTRLESLLTSEDERDSKRQKYESIMEEMRSVSLHTYLHVKGFNVRWHAVRF